jgi:hypothetical protein
MIFDTGAERMRITSAGDVGIGTSSPVSRLQVAEANRVFDNPGNLNVYTTDAATTNTGGSIGFGGANTTGGTTPYVYAKIQGIKEGSASTWNGAMIFGTTAGSSAMTERMRITSGGDVGIGTASPTAGYKLDVSGSANASGSFVSGGGTTSQAALGNKTLEFYNTGAGDGLIKSSDDTSSFTSIALNKTEIKLLTDNTERMRITSAGNLGLGTSSATYRLEVNLASGANLARFTGPEYSQTVFVGGTQGCYIQNWNSVSVLGTDTASPLAFATNSTERLRITATGDVGIGTASPTTKLTAYNGTSRTLIRAASDLNFSGAYLGTASSTNRGASLELVGHLDGSNSASWRTAVAVDLFGGLADMVFSYAGSSSTYAGLSYSEKMRITTPGNVLVGSSTDFGGRLTLIPTTNPTSASASANQIAIGESTSNTGYRLNVGYILVSGSYYAGSIQSIAGSTGAPLLLNADGGNVGVGTVSPSY